MSAHFSDSIFKEPKTIHVRHLAARCVRVFAKTVRPKKEGAGNAGCPMHPQPRVRSLSEAHERSHHRYTGVNPAFPAQWFYGLFRALPGETNSSCHRHPRIKVLSKARSGRLASANLTPATGARTTRLCRPLKRRSSRTLADRSRGSSRPAIAMARLTLSRPPHPAPRS